MAWNHPDWTSSLDRSLDAVFRSFWAIALTAPFAFVEFFSLRRIVVRVRDTPIPPLIEAPFAFALFTEAVAYVLDWAASLVALVLAARAVGASRRVGDAIIGFNWIQVVTTIVQAVLFAVVAAVGRPELFAAVLLPGAAIVIALNWGVFRRSLGVGVAATISIFLMVALLDVIVRAAVEMAAVAILHAGA